jgi:trimethylamine:corrinoid methyltransferase-like protein
MLSLVLAAAEPSKTPFYIAGGVLAAYAVVLAGIGLTRPSFPFNERGARAVMGVSLVLIVVTIATAIATSK